MEDNNINISPAILKQAEREKNAEEVQISVIDIINMMLAFWWIIAIMAIVVGGGTYMYSKLTSVDKYESNLMLYIDTQTEQTTDDVNTVSLQGAQKLLPTYIKVLESTPFLEDVSDDIENKYSAATILDMIHYEAVEETNIIKLTVVSTDSHDAYILAKSIMRNAPDKITQVFEGGSVKIIEYPKEASSPITGNDLKLGIIGFVAGIAIAVLIIFLINLFDTSVKSSEELTKKYGFPILGEIPNLMDV